MTTGSVCPSTIEWRLTGYNIQCGWNSSLRILSPDFHLQDSSWYLEVACESYGSTHACIYLCRRDSGCPKTVTYTIKVYGKCDVKEFTKTSCFANSTASTGHKFSIQNVAQQSQVLITCFIKNDTLRPVSESAPMPRAVQTTVPAVKSRAIQTEVANSAIEKDNSKPKDWPLLDTKDDALLTEGMKELLTKGKDHDVTLCVQDKEFRAHRSILSTRSPVFAMMLSHDTKESNTGTINIEDCDPESFDVFLLYVYSGRTENLTPSNALKIYHPADKYDFPVLKERCVSLLKTSLSVESICDVVLLAAKHGEKELLEVAMKFFAQNIKEIVVPVRWQKFMPQNPVVANELIVKSMEIILPDN